MLTLSPLAASVSSRYLLDPSDCVSSGALADSPFVTVCRRRQDCLVHRACRLSRLLLGSRIVVLTPRRRARRTRSALSSSPVRSLFSSPCFASQLSLTFALAVVLIFTWGFTCAGHFKHLAGKAAPREFQVRSLSLASSSLSLHLPPLARPLADSHFHRSLQNLVTYKAMTFADQITAIDSCVAYHNGPNYTVEVDLVMHADTTLRVAHDVCVLDLSPSRRRRGQPRADSTFSLSRSLAARRLCRTSSRSCRRSTARSCTSTTRRATSPSTARPSRPAPRPPLPPRLSTRPASPRRARASSASSHHKPCRLDDPYRARKGSPVSLASQPRPCSSSAALLEPALRFRLRRTESVFSRFLFSICLVPVKLAQRKHPLVLTRLSARPRASRRQRSARRVHSPLAGPSAAV